MGRKEALWCQADGNEGLQAAGSSNCSPLGKCSPVKRNTNTSFENLEKRFVKLYVKNHITTDICGNLAVLCDFSAIDKNNLEKKGDMRKKQGGGLTTEGKCIQGLLYFESMSSEGYCVKGVGSA